VETLLTSKSYYLQSQLKTTQNTIAASYIYSDVLFSFVRLLLQRSSSVLIWTSARHEVLNDDVGMLPYIMQFMDLFEKVEVLCLVSKAFNRSIHDHGSWYELPIWDNSGENAFRAPAWLQKMVHVQAVSQLEYGAYLSFDNTIPDVRLMQKVLHLRLGVTVKFAMHALTAWPKLQTLRICHRGSDLARTPSKAGAMMLALTHATDLRVLILDWWVLNIEPDLPSWPAFKSVERFTCILDTFTCPAITEHGAGLKHLDILRINNGMEKRVAALMRQRGRQLESLHIQQSVTGGGTMVDVLINHTGNLRMLAIDYFNGFDQSDDIVNVVRANCLSLRALHIKLGGSATRSTVSLPELEALLDNIWDASGGRLEYLHLTWQQSDDHGYYAQLPSAMIRRFRCAKVAVFFGIRLQHDFVSEEDALGTPVTVRYDTAIMKMYSDGLSPYPARV
jgi:hypothetical protein